MKPPSESLAIWRGNRAKGEEVRFGPEVQVLLHEVFVDVARERQVAIHACATCPTHVNGLVSFRSPGCTCERRKWCLSDCLAKAHVDELVTRMKRKMGQAVAKRMGTCGRKWFSRGWDVAAVRDREHFDYLVTQYLPDHETSQGGAFRRYG